MTMAVAISPGVASFAMLRDAVEALDGDEGTDASEESEEESRHASQRPILKDSDEVLIHNKREYYSKGYLES